MVNYGASLKKPFLDLKRLIIGILLSLLPVVRLFARGYYLEASGVTKRKIPLDKLPRWTEFGDLFVKGLLSFFISFLYLLPALIIFLIGAGSVIFNLIKQFINLVPSGATEEVIENTIMQNTSIIINSVSQVLPYIIISAVLAIIAAYLIPIATLNYLNKNDFGKAFSFNTILNKAFTGKYFGSWILFLILGGIIAIILTQIPIIGGAAAYFIVGIIEYSIFGQVYKELK